ncbi:MAG: hypothetical protein MJK15_02910 [Colwellia sp.]|nr:hypothetical protein [Colwellia sp.]
MQKIDKEKLAQLVSHYALKSPLKAKIINYIGNAQADFNYFSTMTYKENIKRDEDLLKHGRYFANHFNTAMGHKGFYKRVMHDVTAQAPLISIVEGDGFITRFHYHFILHKPDNVSHDEFATRVKWCWYKATDKMGSMLISDFKPIYDSAGLINYLTKEVTTNDIDALNLSATHIY